MNSSKVFTIYCHTHIDSGRRYVGLTKKTLLQRWNQHVYSANHRKLGKQSHFWSAIVKYGPGAFSHEVLEIVTTSLEGANLAEEKWINEFQTRDPSKGFNLMPGGSHTPHPISNPWDRPEYRAKAIERIKSPEHRGKLSQAAKNRNPESLTRYSQVSSETRRKLSEATARAATPERRAELSAFRIGKKASEATLKKLRNPSPERSANISRAQKGKVISPECKKKLSFANKGRCHRPETLEQLRNPSPELRAKISAATKAAFARKKLQTAEVVNVS